MDIQFQQPFTKSAYAEAKEKEAKAAQKKSAKQPAPKQNDTMTSAPGNHPILGGANFNFSAENPIPQAADIDLAGNTPFTTVDLRAEITSSSPTTTTGRLHVLQLAAENLASQAPHDSPTSDDTDRCHLDQEWEVDKIIGEEKINGKLHYMVKWMPCLVAEDDMENATEAVREWQDIKRKMKARAKRVSDREFDARQGRKRVGRVKNCNAAIWSCLTDFGMSFCKHTGWLRVWKRGGQATLEISDRPSRLLDEVRREEPLGVVVFIGHQRKYGALGALDLRSRSARARKSHGEIHLDVAQLHENGQKSNQQILIADGDLPVHGQLPRTRSNYSCHEVTSTQYEDPPQLAASVSDGLYHRALFPLTDVICIFAEDIGGTDIAIQYLSVWSRKGPSSSAVSSPAVILVVDRGSETKARAKVSAEKLERPQGRFRAIRVVGIDREAHQISNRRQAKSYQTLSREMSQLLRAGQRERGRESLLFSARHVLEFLRLTAACATQADWTPLDFVKASRLPNRVEENVEGHILNLVSHLPHQDDVVDVAAPLIASSFLLNHYVPDMHDFAPAAVFGSLYQKSCDNVAKAMATHRDEAGLPNVAHDFPSLIASRFSVYLRQRTPALPAFSDGHSSSYPAATGCANSCVICGLGTDQFRIRIKPDTADARILSIDGGGIRGRGPLEFLRVLEDTIDLPVPVQRHFDVVFGTSSGAMTACALCLNGWDVDRCIEYFELSSCQAFDTNRLFRVVAPLVGDVPILSPLLQVLSSLLVDSKYSAKRLESIQKDAYGESRSIVDSYAASEMGISLGVTLTTTDDASTCIATNYNGLGCQNVTDYTTLTFRDGARNVPLWEIYFTPHHIAGAGTFQDGGLAFNNPAAIALKEAGSLFPAPTEPSVVVSLGTGSTSQKRSADATSLWDGLFPARLFRAFWRQGDSAAAWDQLLRHQKLDKRGDFFRFDIRFGVDQPALDDVGSMREVARMAREIALASTEMRRLAKCLRANLFFLELDTGSPLVMRCGTYCCLGKLKCRLRAGSEELRVLLTQLRRSSAVFKCHEQELLAASGGGDGSPDAVQFAKDIAIEVPGLHHAFSITLAEESAPSNISGSPFTLDRLQKQQRLYAPFGTSYHRERHAACNEDSWGAFV
ncbi:hypothetical protein ARSEF4850_003607 [Beauveria asiatica]